MSADSHPSPTPGDDPPEGFEGPVELPITGDLDLHTFRPRELKELIPDYLSACQERGILTVRIVHGKGIGNLRRTVHSILEKNPEVVSFAMAGEQMGGWGATMVQLRSKPGGARGRESDSPPREEGG